jgi:hypothetical protein
MRLKTSVGLLVCLAAGCADEGEAPFVVPEEKPLTVENQPCRQTLIDADGEISLVGHFDYADDGRRIHEVDIDAEGNIEMDSTIVYDRNWRFLEFESTFPEDPEYYGPGQRILNVYDTFGRQLRAQNDFDRDGVYEDVEVFTAWNAAGRATASTRTIAGRPGVAKGTYTYDERGRFATNEFVWPDGEVMESQTMVFDDVARTRTWTRGTPTWQVRSISTYDEQRRIVRREQDYLSWPPGHNVTTYEYDGDRVSREIHVNLASGASSSTEWEYDCD